MTVINEPTESLDGRITDAEKLDYVYAQAQRMEAFVNEAVPALEALSKHPLLGAFLGKKK